MDEPERALATVHPVDWTLLVAITTLASLTVFIPIPLVDGLVEMWLRRRLVRGLASRRGLALDDEAVKTLADPESKGCQGCMFALILWPVKKLFKSVLAFLLFKDMADISVDVLHRGLLWQEAFDKGWLPNEPIRVRNAIDRTVERFHVKPIERAVWGRFRHEDVPWREKIGRVTLRGRDANAKGDAVSPALDAANRVPGLLPELLHAFHVEMGVVPEGETAIAGLIEPEMLPPEGDASIEKRIEAPPLDDAQEVPNKQEPDAS